MPGTGILGQQLPRSITEPGREGPDRSQSLRPTGPPAARSPPGEQRAGVGWRAGSCTMLCTIILCEPSRPRRKWKVLFE